MPPAPSANLRSQTSKGLDRPPTFLVLWSLMVASTLRGADAEAVAACQLCRATPGAETRGSTPDQSRGVFGVRGATAAGRRGSAVERRTHVQRRWQCPLLRLPPTGVPYRYRRPGSG